MFCFTSQNDKNENAYLLAFKTWALTQMCEWTVTLIQTAELFLKVRFIFFKNGMPFINSTDILSSTYHVSGLLDIAANSIDTNT